MLNESTNFVALDEFARKWGNTVLVGQEDQEGCTSDTSKNSDVAAQRDVMSMRPCTPISGGAQAVQEDEVGLEDISNQIQLFKNQLGPCDKISIHLNLY